MSSLDATSTTSGIRRRKAAAIAVVIIAAVSVAVVGLVLTGIIAEPETVIESIVRTLLGS